MHEPGDAVVITPLNTRTQGPTQGPTSAGSEDASIPYTIRGGNFRSRPSPITEVVEMLRHSQDGSNNSGTWISSRSGDTSASSPVVMTAERVQLTPMALSLASPSYTTSPLMSDGSHYEESVPPTGATNNFAQLPPPLDDPPPLPMLLHVQPLNLGKKRSLQS